MPTRTVPPTILPMRRPAPLVRRRLTYLVGGRPVRVLAERWRAEDAAHASMPCEPDPSHPGEVIGLALLDLRDRSVLEPVTSRDVSSALARCHLYPGA